MVTWGKANDNDNNYINNKMIVIMVNKEIMMVMVFERS
jgi:hypothetical protein